MVTKFAVSKQFKVKDYPWVSTQVNSASRQTNVAQEVDDAKQALETSAEQLKAK